MANPWIEVAPRMRAGRDHWLGEEKAPCPQGGHQENTMGRFQLPPSPWAWGLGQTIDSTAQARPPRPTALAGLQGDPFSSQRQHAGQPGCPALEQPPPLQISLACGQDTLGPPRTRAGSHSLDVAVVVAVVEAVAGTQTQRVRGRIQITSISQRVRLWLQSLPSSGGIQK